MLLVTIISPMVEAVSHTVILNPAIILISSSDVPTNSRRYVRLHSTFFVVLMTSLPFRFVLPIASIACSRLVLSLRGMYFARSSLRDPGEFIAAPRETAIDYDKAETNDFELHDRAIHSRQP